MQPIFVVGYMHSGTTLLLNSLSRHPKVFGSTGETKFFDYLPLVKKEFGHINTQPGRERLEAFCTNLITSSFDEALKRHRDGNPGPAPPGNLEVSPQPDRGVWDYADAFRNTFEGLAFEAGASCWLEKTPTHIYHLNEIWDAYEDALCVEIVRDPRDILASKKTRRETVWTDRYPSQQRQRKHFEKAYDPLWDSLAWKAAIKAGESARHRNQSGILTIRYEDLVTAPEETLREVCDFLTLEYRSELLDVPAGVPAEWETTATRQAGITTLSVNRWKKILSPSEQAVCEFLLRKEMQHNNYALQESGLSDFLLAFPQILRAVIDLPIRLYRKMRLGGWRLMWTFVKNYRKRLRYLR